MTDPDNPGRAHARPAGCAEGRIHDSSAPPSVASRGDCRRLPDARARQTDLLDWRIDGMFDTIPALVEPVRSGRLRGLAVTTKKRLTALPDLPTVGDSVPGFEVNGFIGFGAPRNAG
jgi:hypothetical protein